MNGKWAEILPLKFTTEDDVDIYGDMKTWVVDKDFTLMNQSNYSGALYDYKYFYHKENALAYIEKHKGKPLEDYEDILCTLHQGELERSVVDNGNIYSVSIGLFYRTLKLNEPKLYTKILQLIADYLNDARYIHERGQASFHINKEGRVTLHMGDDEGCVYFKSKELAFKAIDIMGSKLEYLFN